MIQIFGNKLPDPPLYNRPAYPDCHLQILFYWTVRFVICRPRQLIRIVCNQDHFHKKLRYDIPLLVDVCGNVLHKKLAKCDHCNPLNQHVDQSLATRCVFSPLSIRAALGEVPCCYCRYLILQHYSMGCRPF